MDGVVDGWRHRLGRVVLQQLEEAASRRSGHETRRGVLPETEEGGACSGELQVELGPLRQRSLDESVFSGHIGWPARRKFTSRTADAVHTMHEAIVYLVALHQRETLTTSLQADLRYPHVYDAVQYHDDARVRPVLLDEAFLELV